MHDLSQVRLKVAFHMCSYNHAATISRGLMLLTGSVHTCPPWVLHRFTREHRKKHRERGYSSLFLHHTKPNKAGVSL